MNWSQDGGAHDDNAASDNPYNSEQESEEENEDEDKDKDGEEEKGVEGLEAKYEF